MPKPEQQEIPGTEAPTIKEIERAAAKYVDARDARMKLTEKECAAKAQLIEVCKEHASEMSVNGDGDRVYKYDEEVAILTDRTNVKIKAAFEDEGGEE